MFKVNPFLSKISILYLPKTLMRALARNGFLNNPAKFTCSKSIVETLEKGVKYFQS